MKITEKQMRDGAAYQFELQAHKLFLHVIQRLPNFKYLLRDELKETNITAIILAESFDYYEYRLHRGRGRVSLLIVQEHNAVVPVDVLELRSGIVFDAGQAPTFDRESKKRRNYREKKLLLSHLLLETERGQQELQQMGERTRQRYLREKRAYLTPRVGRPIAS
jgi:hypothetical protein